jgi:hypothetical protein
MSGFSREWLELREPADRAARSAALVTQLRAEHPAAEPLQVVDLGAGSGANLRFMAPLLGGRQDWLLVDDAPALREAVPRALAGADFACSVRTRRSDLAQRDALDWPPGALVTASALLDLVSPQWLAALAAQCRDLRSSALFALSYDGRIGFTATEPEDDEVRALVNEHQRQDKGFGPALGPAAAELAPRAFAAAGFSCATARSDWQLAPEAAALQAAFVDGLRQAASEIAPARAAAFAAWHARRLEHVARGRSSIVVGHVDFAAWLPDGQRAQSTRTRSSAGSS